MIIPWVIFLLILLALACPAAAARKSWRTLAEAMVMSFLLVVLPLALFFLSGLAGPEWKGGCKHGWVDCLIISKVAFFPYVLIATAALYKIDVLRVDASQERWPVIGVFWGAILSLAGLIFAAFYINLAGVVILPLLVIAGWYVVRAVLLMRASSFDFWSYFAAALSLIPFGVWSWLWAVRLYEDLPNEAPKGCFVVTAAGRGHRQVVGPFFEIERGGRRRFVNQQLVTFWQLEAAWRKTFPRGHRIFRRGYNWLGPKVAARIRSPWVADGMFLALKPAELFARWINRHIQ